MVTNIIEIEEGANWLPPEGHYLQDGGKKGQKWDGTKYVDIPKKEPEVDPIIAEYKNATTNTERIAILAKKLGLKLD